MNLTELKKKSIAELLAIAKEMGLDNMARSRKQDIIFAILKTHARNGEASTATVCLRYFLMVLAFYAHQRALI